MLRWSLELRGVETLRLEEKQSTTRFSDKGEMNRGEIIKKSRKKGKTGTRGDVTAVPGMQRDDSSVLCKCRRKAQLAHPWCLVTHRSASNKARQLGRFSISPRFLKAKLGSRRVKIHERQIEIAAVNTRTNREAFCSMRSHAVASEMSRRPSVWGPVNRVDHQSLGVSSCSLWFNPWTIRDEKSKQSKFCRCWDWYPS